MEQIEIKNLLNKMKHSFFEIDGAIGKLHHYQFKPEYKKVVIKFSTRTYEHLYSDMEDVFKTWKPVNTPEQLAFIPQVNLSISDEIIEIHHKEPSPDESNLGIEPQATGEISKIDQDQSDFDATLEKTYSTALKQMMDSANFVDQRLKETIMKLKQGGEKAKAEVPVATQVIKGCTAIQNNRNGIIEMLKAGINMSKQHNKTKPNDGKKKGNDNQKS